MEEARDGMQFSVLYRNWNAKNGTTGPLPGRYQVSTIRLGLSPCKHNGG